MLTLVGFVILVVLLSLGFVIATMLSLFLLRNIDRAQRIRRSREIDDEWGCERLL